MDNNQEIIDSEIQLGMIVQLNVPFYWRQKPLLFSFIYKISLLRQEINTNEWQNFTLTHNRFIINNYRCLLKFICLDKDNNKITENRAIFQRERPNSNVNKQTKSVNNRKTGKTAMALTWYRHFQRNSGLNQNLNKYMKQVLVLNIILLVFAKYTTV